MALNLVTGYKGQDHVTAEQWADFNRGIFGNSAVLPVGNQMAVEIQTANQITVKDGVGVFDGREVYIGYGESENISIVSGTQGMLRNDILVVRYTREEETGVENVTFEVVNGTPVSSSPKDPSYEDMDIRTGVFMSQKPFCRIRLNGTAIETVEPLYTVADTIPGLMQEISFLGSALADFRSAEALHSAIITEAKSYTLDKSIADYKLIEIIMQYGSTNWITTRLFRSSTLSQFPNIMDSAKTSMLECYYNMYISGKDVNVGAISSNTRILIRGIK